MEDDGGSVLVSNVDPELKAAQIKVRFLIKGIIGSVCELLIEIYSINLDNLKQT